MDIHSPFALSDFYFFPKEKIKIVRRVGEYIEFHNKKGLGVKTKPFDLHYLCTYGCRFNKVEDMLIELKTFQLMLCKNRIDCFTAQGAMFQDCSVERL